MRLGFRSRVGHGKFCAGSLLAGLGCAEGRGFTMAVRDETRMLLESMTRLFDDKSTKQVIDRAEVGEFASGLWGAVAETGVPLAALPESAGGADAEWSDLYAVLRVAGRFAAPIPLAETMLAAWVASAP